MNPIFEVAWEISNARTVILAHQNPMKRTFCLPMGVCLYICCLLGTLLLSVKKNFQVPKKFSKNQFCVFFSETLPPTVVLVSRRVKFLATVFRSHLVGTFIRIHDNVSNEHWFNSTVAIGIAWARQFVHTTFRTHDISYKNQNQTFRTKAKPDISYKKETRHSVQK